MSEENVEVVRAALDAYNREDYEAMLKYATPDCELDWSRSVGPQRGVYTIDQFSQLNIGATFESVRTEAQDFIDHKEHVVTPLIGHMRGRDGIELTARFTYLWTLRDGTVTRVTIYQEVQDALEAAGLSDQTMSQQDMDVLRRIGDAFNSRDIAAFVSCCDPDVELDPGRVLIGTPIYRGHDGIERLFRDMAVAWEELQNEEIFDVVAVGSDDAVLVGEATGRGKTAGVPFAERMAVHVKFTHGKVVRLAWFATKEEALEAAGLRE